MSNIFNMGPGVNFNIDTDEGMKNAIAWQLATFNLLVDGGRWIVPRSMSIYEVNKTLKVCRRIMGMFPEPTIQRVVEAAGWKYEEKSDA